MAKFNTLENYEPIPITGCWIWKGKWLHSGYGHTSGRGVAAHRFFYEAHRGLIPPGMCVCHKCDTPSCVNPEHLFLGSLKDNTQDAVKKGRLLAKPGDGRLNNKGARGPRKKPVNRNNGKFPVYVKEIRESSLSDQQLAMALGMSRAGVNKVRRGVTWPESGSLPPEA